MGGVKELFKDEKNMKNLNPAKMGKVYQSMAKAMDPQMLRAIGGMSGIETMMKQMQQEWIFCLLAATPLNASRDT